jgi:hypothetical protein
LGDCWKEGGESLKSKITVYILPLGGWEAGRSGGGEWFGGVITKGREEKVNVAVVLDVARSQGRFVPGRRIAIRFMKKR